MRRNRRGVYEDNENYKTILLMSGGILIIAIITFFVVYGIYKSKIDSVELGQIDGNSSKIDLNSVSNLMDNSTVVSSSMGKNVNEVKNSIVENKVLNSTNTITNESSDKISSNAVATSNKENSNTTVNKNENKVNEEKGDKIVEEKNPIFQSPIENGELLRGFASENLVYSETLQEWITHTAIDIKAPKTTVVKSAEAGVVENIKNDPRYGLTIIVSHSKNYKTVYSNLLTTEFVNVGDNVEKGQSLGTVGSTAAFEIADEPHLHFEIIKDGEKVDPTLYIN